mmetsp:Transcript_12752/g.44957  ORF Transcript_12752/g.44957 Transcript_12752/m.44957 type:complete len:244 (+) Transcript_12752:1344-2075(+)
MRYSSKSYSLSTPSAVDTASRAPHASKATDVTRVDDAAPWTGQSGAPSLFSEAEKERSIREKSSRASCAPPSCLLNGQPKVPGSAGGLVSSISSLASTSAASSLTSFWESSFSPSSSFCAEPIGRSVGRLRAISASALRRVGHRSQRGRGTVSGRCRRRVTTGRRLRRQTASRRRTASRHRIQTTRRRRRRRATTPETMPFHQPTPLIKNPRACRAGPWRCAPWPHPPDSASQSRNPGSSAEP